MNSIKVYSQNNELFKFDNVLKWTNQYSLMCLSTYGFVITSVIETVILAFEVILISMTIENQSN